MGSQDAAFYFSYQSMILFFHSLIILAVHFNIRGIKLIYLQ